MIERIREQLLALFIDRIDAGQKLAQKLRQYLGHSDVIVLALPRGGVPVAYEVARELQAPLDIFLVRKLGVPGHEELAMGAIASGGVVVFNEQVIESLNISKAMMDEACKREQAELERRETAYRGKRARISLGGKTVILIDDGLATGASMRAAVAGIQQHHPSRVVVAVPVAAPQTCEEFKKIVDHVVCAETPQPFYGVGVWYENFPQTSDEEVRALLQQASVTYR